MLLLHQFDVLDVVRTHGRDLQSFQKCITIDGAEEVPYMTDGVQCMCGVVRE